VIEVWIDKEALAEVDVIIEMMPEDDAAKIPEKVRKFLKEKKSTTYIPNIRTDIPLYCQELKKDTKTMCSLLYRNYLCDPKEKLRLENEDQKIVAQNRKGEFYLFEEKRKENGAKEKIRVELANPEENNELMKYSERGWIKKIFNRILSRFRKNHWY